MFSYFKHSAYRWFATEVIFLLAILMDKKKNPSAETNFFFSRKFCERILLFVYQHHGHLVKWLQTKNGGCLCENIGTV